VVGGLDWRGWALLGGGGRWWEIVSERAWGRLGVQVGSEAGDAWGGANGRVRVWFRVGGVLGLEVDVGARGCVLGGILGGLWRRLRGRVSLLICVWCRGGVMSWGGGTQRGGGFWAWLGGVWWGVLRAAVLLVVFRFCVVARWMFPLELMLACCRIKLSCVILIGGGWWCRCRCCTCVLVVCFCFGLICP